MKIEFVKDSSNGPFIRLFDFSNAEVLEVKKLVDQLAKGTIESLDVHKHANINPIDNCHLTLKIGNESKGISSLGGQNDFVCELNKAGFENMSGLLASFALHPVEKEGFQWLDETSEISLLISPSGRF